MKRTISTLLFGLIIIAAAAIETEVQSHMKSERLKAAHQYAELASAQRPNQ